MIIGTWFQFLRIFHADLKGLAGVLYLPDVRDTIIVPPKNITGMHNTVLSEKI